MYPIDFSSYKPKKMIYGPPGPGDAAGLLRGASHLRQRGLQWLHRRASLRLRGTDGGWWWPGRLRKETWGPLKMVAKVKDGGEKTIVFEGFFEWIS